MTKKGILTEIFFLKGKGKKHQKKLDCNFITNNPNKENYDTDYEIDRIKRFIREFKNKNLRELEKLKEKLNL